MAKEKAKFEYESPSAPALVLQSFLGLLTLLVIVGIGVLMIDIVFIAPQATSQEQLLSVRYIAIGGPIRALDYLLFAGSLVIWLRRVYRNVRSFGVEQIKSKEWECIWGWILPVANFVTPPTVMQEVWKASNPEILDSVAWKEQKNSKLVVFWWSMFLLSVLPQILNFLAAIFLPRAPGLPDELINSPLLVCFLQTLFGVSCGALLLVVRDITKRQIAKHEKLGVSGVAVPPSSASVDTCQPNE